MYELRLMLLALFGLAALYCAASTVGIWMRRRRLSYFGCTLARAFAVVTVLILIVPVPPSAADGPPRVDLQGRSSGLWKRYSAAQQAEVEEMHRELAPARESYRQAHGEYPPTLPVAGIPLPETRYGPITITTAAQGTSSPSAAPGRTDSRRTGTAGRRSGPLTSSTCDGRVSCRTVRG